MNKNSKYFIFASLVLFLCGRYAVAAEGSQSPVSGDPSIKWDIIGNNQKIENNAYQRCLLIRSVIPGQGKSSETQRNIFDTMSKYVSYLYAQSVMVSVNIAAEEEAVKLIKASKTGQIELIKNGINYHLGNITRRLNIIASLEAGVAMIDMMTELQNLPSGTYARFKIHKEGAFGETGDNCDALK